MALFSVKSSNVGFFGRESLLRLVLMLVTSFFSPLLKLVSMVEYLIWTAGLLSLQSGAIFPPAVPTDTDTFSSAGLLAGEAGSVKAVGWYSASVVLGIPLSSVKSNTWL